MPDVAATNDAPTPHVGHLIRRAQQIHTRRWSDEVSVEVTSPQLLLLHALERHPGVDQRTLGQLVSLDRSTTADVVERMIGRGFIERSRDPGDLRRNVLRITAEGRALVAELHPRTIAMNTRLLELLQPTDGSELVRLLRSFIEAAELADASDAEIRGVAPPRALGRRRSA